jgi:PGF-pre-PGF domain-containing protein
MIKVKKRKFCLFFFVLLLLILLPNLSNALIEDFNIIADKSLSLYDCSNTYSKNPIKITNTGQVTSKYLISVSGSLANYVSLGPISFILNPGQSQDITTLYKIPCGLKKKQEIKYYINTELGSKKIFKQNIIVTKQNNIDLTPIEYSNQIKPCKTASYKFILKNSGLFQETYSIIFKKPFGFYTNVSFNEITLNPGDEVPFYIFITPPCEMHGNFTVPFSIKTKNTKLYANTFAYLLIDSAYDYTLKPGKLYPFLANNYSKIFLQQDKDEIYSICTNSKEILPIKLKNTADLKNSYEINLDSPKWVTSSNNLIELNSKQEKTIELNIDTKGIEGNYNLNLYALSKLGALKQEKNIILSVNNCNKPLISTLDNKKSFVLNYNPTKIPIKIINNGQNNALYSIKIDSNQNWMSLENSSITINAGQEGIINLLSIPNNLTKKGTYALNLQVNVKNTNIVYHDTLKVKLITMNTFDNIYYNFIIPYLGYLLVSLALLVLIIVLLVLVLKKYVKKNKQIKLRKSKKQDSQKYSKGTLQPKYKFMIIKNKKLFGFLLLTILLLLSSIFFIFIKNQLPFTSQINKTIDNENITITDIKEESIYKSFFQNLVDTIVFFIVKYWIYFIIGFLVLLLLIIIPLIKNKKKKPKQFGLHFNDTKKQKRFFQFKKAKPKIQPKKKLKRIKIIINKKILIILASIISIIVIGFIAYYFANGFLFSSIYSSLLIFYSFAKYILSGIVILAFFLLIILFLKMLNNRNLSYININYADKKIVLRNKYISCGEVIIKLNNSIQNAKLLLRKIKKPTFINAGHCVYEYFKIEKYDIFNSDIAESTIRFKVKKSWLKKNNVKSNNIILRRYQNKWQGINTTLVNEDQKYFYYESVLNHLSYFAIVGIPSKIQGKKQIVKEFKDLKVQDIKIEKKAKKYKSKHESLWIKKLFSYFQKIINVISIIIKPKSFKINIKKLLLIALFLCIIMFVIGIGYLFLNNFFSLLISYYLYILIGISVLVLIILLTLTTIWLKTKKPFQIIKKFKKIIILIILLLFLFAILFTFYLYIDFSFIKNINEFGKINLTMSNQNQTDINKKTHLVLNESLENIDDEPNVILTKEIGIPDQEWNEDTNISINLGDYFFDPDNDNLYYTNTKLQNIDITYLNNEAVLIPRTNWYGNEFVIFTAKDMKGGEVDSNLVKLTVIDTQEDNILKRIKNYILK